MKHRASDSQKYDIPFYSSSWIPHQMCKSNLMSQAAYQWSAADDDYDKAHDTSSAPTRQNVTAAPFEYHAVLAGGGGEGRSGIPNGIRIVRFESASNSLSPKPVAKLQLDSELPYRMIVHPGGDGLICALPKNCRFFKWEEEKDSDGNNFGIKMSEEAISQLEGIGQQLALAFSNDGSILALGGEDGTLRVFRWPSMEILLCMDEVHSSVKDLCFSPDGRFLVWVRNNGPGSICDIPSFSVASLPQLKEEHFAFCKFSQTSKQKHILYVVARTGRGGRIVTWGGSSPWQRLGTKLLLRQSVSSFNVSPDGNFLSVGTIEGDVLLISSCSMSIHARIRRAHMGIVTALAFSPDSRVLVTVSMDSSARVTLVDDKRRGDFNRLIVFFIVLAAMAACHLAKNRFLSSELEN